jgi:hypothetical protein
VLEPDETVAVQGQAASADQHMDVGMESQLTGPGVQDQGQAKGQPFPGLAQRQQSVGGGTQQGLVDHRRLEPGQDPQFRRQGEHHVEVADSQDPTAARSDPLLLGQGLALRAVPVPA